MTPALLTSRSRRSWPARELGGEGPHGLEVAEVKGAELELGVGDGAADRLRRLLALLAVADGQDDLRSRPGELARRDQAEPAVGAGDHGQAPGQRRHILGRPARHQIPARWCTESRMAAER